MTKFQEMINSFPNIERESVLFKTCEDFFNENPISSLNETDKKTAIVLIISDLKGKMR